jgi:hypothetical protein
MYRQLTPTSQLIAASAWPSDLLPLDDVSALLDAVFVVDDWVVLLPAGGLQAGFRVIFAGELALRLAGLDGVALVFGGPAVPLPMVAPPPPPPDPDGLVEDFPVLDADQEFIPDDSLAEGWTEVSFSLDVAADFSWTARLHDVTVALRLDSGLLRPAGGSDSVNLTTRGDIALDNTFDLTVSGFSAVDLSPCEIGGTGLILAATGVELDLSRTWSPPEVLAAGFDESFLGVYLGTATVQLPDWLTGDAGQPVTLGVTGGVIGSGGFGGALHLSGPPLAARLFGFGLTLESADLAFTQSTVSGGGLSGTLRLPFFENDVGVAITVSADGQVQVTIDDPAADGGLLTLPVAGVGQLAVSSLRVDTSQAAPAIEVSGTFVPSAVAGLALPGISVDGLRIAADGTVTVGAIGLTLPDQLAGMLAGFPLEITSVALGSELRDGTVWNWIECAAGLRLGDDLPGASARVRLLWDRHGHDCAVECDGVSIDFTVPDVLTLNGTVDLDGSEFHGDVTLALTALDVTITGRVTVGQTTDRAGDGFGYFSVDLDAELPLGIPLACTGLALYGLGGMVASNMVPDSTGGQPAGDEFDWYTDWYLGWDQPWVPRRGGFGLGAGVTLGTLADNGFTFATKVALVLSFPGPIVMLQGVGNILRLRSSLPGQSTFSSLILFDGTAADLAAALAMSYSLPPEGALEGKVLDASGTAAASFDLDDASNWHIGLGAEDPGQRIRARALSLFDADAYLLLDHSKLAAGASIGYTEGFDFRVVSVQLNARMAGEAEVSWAPSHLSGQLGFTGGVSLRAFGVELGLQVSATVAAETPTPFQIVVDASVDVSLPWPLDDLTIPVHLEWHQEAEPTAVTPVLHSAWFRDRVSTASLALPLTPDANTSNDDAYYPMAGNQVATVALDGSPALVFNRNVDDVARAGAPRPAGGPDVVESADGDQSFSYRLTGLALQRWGPPDGGGADEWTGDTDVPDPAGTGTVRGIELPGSWQATGDDAGTELVLAGDGPFDFCRDNTSAASGQPADAPPWTPFADGFLATHLAYPDTTVDVRTAGFRDFEPWQYLGHEITQDGVTFTRNAESGIRVFDMSAEGGDFSIPLNVDEPLLIGFPQPAAQIVLTVQGWSQASGGPQSAALLIVGGMLASGGAPLQAVSLGPVPNATSVVRDVTLDGRFTGVTGLTLRGLNVFLISVRWVSAAQLASLDDLAADGTRLLAARPLLQPDTDYRLTLGTETAATTPAGTTGSVQYAFFRTGGPPADLRPYLASAVPAAGAGPCFGAYDLRFGFTTDRVIGMYGGDLDVLVTDDNGQPVLAAGGGPALTLTSDGQARPLSYVTAIWLGALTDAGVLPAGSAAPAPADVLQARPADTAGLPAAQRLTVLLRHRGTPVLALPFSTSRWPDFTAMIASFDPAVWPGDTRPGLPTAAGLAELQQAARSTSRPPGPYRDAEGDLFDHILYDLLGSPTRVVPPRPQATGFGDAAAPAAVLVEFPEPIEWDRLTLTVATGAQALSVAIVRDAAGLRALLIRPGPRSATAPALWTAGRYDLTFSYLLDTGQDDLPVLSRGGSPAPEEPPPVQLRIGDPG